MPDLTKENNPYKFETYLAENQSLIGLLDSSAMTLKSIFKKNPLIFNDFLLFLEKTSQLVINPIYLTGMHSFLQDLINKINQHSFLTKNEHSHHFIEKIEKKYIEINRLFLYEYLSNLLISNHLKFSSSFSFDWHESSFTPISNMEYLFDQMAKAEIQAIPLDLASFKIILGQHDLKSYLKNTLGPVANDLISGLSLFKKFYSTTSFDKKIKFIFSKEASGFNIFINLLKKYPELVQPIATHFLLSLRHPKPLLTKGLSKIEKTFLKFFSIIDKHKIILNSSIQGALHHLLSTIDLKFSSYIEDERNLLKISIMHSPLLLEYRKSLREKSRKFIDKINLSVDLRIRYYSEIHHLFDSTTRKRLYDEIKFLIKKEILGPSLDESSLYLEEWRQTVPSASAIYFKIHELVLSKKSHFSSKEKNLLDSFENKIFFDINQLIDENKFRHSRLNNQDSMSYSYIYNSIVKIHQNAIDSFLNTDRKNISLLAKSILAYNKSRQHFGKLKDPSFFSEEKINFLLEDLSLSLTIQELISHHFLHRHEIGGRNYYSFKINSNFPLSLYLTEHSKIKDFQKFSEILKKLASEQKNNLLFRIQKINIRERDNYLFNIDLLQTTKDYAKAIFLESKKRIHFIHSFSRQKMIDTDLPLKNLENLDQHTLSRLQQHQALLHEKDFSDQFIQSGELVNFMKIRLHKMINSKDNDRKFLYYENQLASIHEIIHRLPEIKSRYKSIQYINNFLIKLQSVQSKNEKILLLENELRKELSEEIINVSKEFNSIFLEKISNQINENFDFIYSSLFSDSLSAFSSILTEKSTDIVNDYFKKIIIESEDILNESILVKENFISRDATLIDRIIINIINQILSSILASEQFISLREEIIDKKEISQLSLEKIEQMTESLRKNEAIDLMSSYIEQSRLKDIFISFFSTDFLQSADNFFLFKKFFENLYLNSASLNLPNEEQVKIISFFINKQDEWPLSIKSSMSLLSREASKEGFVLQNSLHFKKITLKVFEETMSSFIDCSKFINQSDRFIAQSKNLLNYLPSLELSSIPIPGSGLLDISFSFIKIAQNLITIQKNSRKWRDGQSSEIFYADEQIEDIKNNIKYLLDNIDYQDEISSELLKIASRTLDELIKLTPVSVPVFKTLENLFEALSLKANKQHRRDLLERAYIEIESASRTIVEKELISSSLSVYPYLDKLKQLDKFIDLDEEDLNSEDLSLSSVENDPVCIYRLEEHAQIGLVLEKIIWCLSDRENDEDSDEFFYHLKKNGNDFFLMHKNTSFAEKSSSLNLSQSLQLGSIHHFVENLTIRHVFGDFECSFKQLTLKEDDYHQFKANFMPSNTSFAWIWNETVDHEPFEQDIFPRFSKESIQHIHEYGDQQDMLKDIYSVSSFSCVNYFKEQHTALLKILLMPPSVIKNICLENIENKTNALIVYEKIKKRINNIQDYCLSNPLFLSIFIDYPIIQKICSDYEQSFHESVDLISDDIDLSNSFHEHKKNIFDKILIQAAKNNDDFLFHSLLFLNANPHVKATSDLTAIQLLNRKETEQEFTRKAINELCEPSRPTSKNKEKEKNFFGNVIELISLPINGIVNIFKKENVSQPSIEEIIQEASISLDKSEHYLSSSRKAYSKEVDFLENSYRHSQLHQDQVTRK